MQDAITTKKYAKEWNDELKVRLDNLFYKESLTLTFTLNNNNKKYNLYKVWRKKTFCWGELEVQRDQGVRGDLGGNA